MKLEITITKRRFWVLVGLLVLVVGLLVFADKPIPVGHSKDEVEGLSELESRVDGLSKNGAWLEGSYCILRKGSSCPTGFEPGILCFDTEDDPNDDFKKGDVGSSGEKSCGGDSWTVEFCCKE